MNNHNPIVSIIIPTFNRVLFLTDALTSIIENDIAPETYELIIVDNNSQDSTPAAVAEFIENNPKHDISHVVEMNQGASHARNRGIEEANAPLLLFIDDDEIADRKLIQQWISFFSLYPDAIGGGGQIVVKFEDPRPSWMSHFLMPLLGEHKISKRIKKYGPSQFPFAGNMAYRKSVFDQFGDLKTDLGRKGKELLAGEEKEFYSRLRKHTDEIYHVPAAKVFHRVDQPRMTPEFIENQALGLGQTIYLMLKKESFSFKMKKLGLEIFKSAATLPLFFGYTLSFNYSKAKMLMKFRWWIWKGLLSMRNK